MAKRMSKRARRNRAIRVVLIVILVLAALAVAVRMLRSEVDTQVYERNQDTALSATVTRGSISTTVSGSGNLTDEDVEEIKVHSGVEIDEILVETGDRVVQGDLLATVDMSTVLTAMSDVQKQIDEKDEEISEASGDEVEDVIRSALAGRVMKIYAQKGDDVSTVMYEHGALALLSLDGYQAVDISADGLSAGDTVTVTGSDGTAFEGTVEKVTGQVATILVSDKKTVYGDTVTITDADGQELGTGELYIHEMLKITGIAGTVEKVRVSENEKISESQRLFSLTDTSFSANYAGLLEERAELEEQLQGLIRIYQDGAIYATVSGSVSSIGSSSTTTTTSTSSMYGFSMGTGTGSSSTSTSTTASSGSDQVVLSICPGTTMTVSLSVDETSILSMEMGQEAAITISAIGDDSFQGTVTDIDTTATTSSGVTVYTVTVTLDKTEKMLAGMSASVTIRIEGVDDALLIPSEALTQTSATSYVYTTYDEETGELGGMVEVTTGMNNGSYVEITGGLSEGDTVYYFEKEESGFSFGNFSFGGMSGGMDFSGMTGGMDFSGMTGGNSGNSGMPGMTGGNSGNGGFGGR